MGAGRLGLETPYASPCLLIYLPLLCSLTLPVLCICTLRLSIHSKDICSAPASGQVVFQAQEQLSEDRQ